MDGADIGKASARAHNGKRSSRISPEEEKAGRLFGDVLVLLLFGVEIVKYGFTAVDFVNHVIDYAYCVVSGST